MAILDANNIAFPGKSGVMRYPRSLDKEVSSEIHRIDADTAKWISIALKAGEKKPLPAAYLHTGLYRTGVAI